MKLSKTINSILYRRLGLLLVSGFIFLANANSQLVMNGGKINMQNGAYVVIQNNNANAITISSTAGGIMQDANSRIRWRIGTTAASYTVPFYFSSEYIPLSFTTSAASGAGYFDLNSYNVPTWKNSDYLPPGVSNVNRGGADNSNRVIDRFWSINAQGYTVKPQLANVVFTYRDAEWNAAGNIITEASLKAQRWNSTLNQWHDYAPAGSANTLANTVTIPSVAAADLYQWWTLVDAAFPLPLHLLSFQARLVEKKVKLDWSTSMEENTKEFVIERSADRNNFYSIDTVAASGNSSTVKYYSTVDPTPLRGVSYYRLKMIDNDGQFTYSAISMIVISGTQVVVYPNPASDKIHVDLAGTKAHSFIIYGASGRAVKTGMISNPVFAIDISRLAQGTYLLEVNSENGKRSFSFIKI